MTIAQLTVGEFGNPQIRRFLHELQASGFEGEVDTSHATRTVLATDNSIYQRYPRAVVFPRHAKDVQRLARRSLSLAGLNPAHKSPARWSRLSHGASAR